MVLCVDEKTSLQPRTRKAATWAAQPGKPVRVERRASPAAGSGSAADAGGSQLPGQGTGYPAPSPQTRTCAINASGSSGANSLR
jgi:hypothetical protein